MTTLLLLLSAQADTTAPVPDGALIDMLVKATRDKNWAALAGALLMLLVWTLRKLAPSLDKKWLPLVSLALGGVPAIALALMHPQGVNVNEIVGALVVIWLMAAGSWASLVEPVRDLLRRRAAAAPAPAPVVVPPPVPPETPPPGGAA